MQTSVDWPARTRGSNGSKVEAYTDQSLHRLVVKAYFVSNSRKSL